MAIREMSLLLGFIVLLSSLAPTMPMTYVNCTIPHDPTFSRNSFPHGFVFGTGSAAYQVARIYELILHAWDPVLTICFVCYYIYTLYFNLDFFMHVCYYIVYILILISFFFICSFIPIKVSVDCRI